MKTCLIAAFLSSALFSCAALRHAPPLTELHTLDLGRNPRAINFPVPFVEQTPKLCGPTALLMVLRQYHPELSLEEVSAAIFTPGAKGTYKEDFLAGARRFGLAPYPVASLYEMLLQLAARQPVVVFHSAGFFWDNYWHYSVLTGYDIAKENFYVHIGKFAHHEIPMSQILYSWREGGSWSYVLLPPRLIPPFASTEETVENGLALLRVDRVAEAQQLATAATKRWPDRFEPRLLLADVQLQLGHQGAALAELKQATELSPGNRALRRKLAELSTSGDSAGSR